ncbi:hypothetical protein BDF20DRAFT_881930 [Mycotypha africana]|uniref:uncharacterized protein n=1 Tax=Mycotypha africana TaxID=64632 RepID=UPI0022FFDA67|nr:uncharacterized protein BDF20DRAFT_881930 [Mycotypha africana]KAI8973352.1 hypothetical protein BDF20DRAFT_881930 [Mycotypha africana]
MVRCKFASIFFTVIEVLLRRRYRSAKRLAKSNCINTQNWTFSPYLVTHHRKSKEKIFLLLMMMTPLIHM